MLKLSLILRVILYLNIFVLLQASIAEAVGFGSRNEFLKDPKIINGSDASLEATRHQVSIRIRSNENPSFGYGHICGGSLISENVVLTAAHCFLDNSSNGTFLPDKDFIVAMGNLDRFECNNNTLVFDILKSVKRVAIFHTPEQDDDIALIILNGTVPANHPTVRPIILNDGALKNNTVCQATGWGVTEENKLSRMLRTVDVLVIDINDCRKNTGYGSDINDGMLCAGYWEGGRDSCTADSGGPLTCRGIQAGIISWGHGCAEPLWPGVYVDVAHFKKWILDEAALYNATLPKFTSIPDGVTSLSYSIFLITFTLIFNFSIVN